MERIRPSTILSESRQKPRQGGFVANRTWFLTPFRSAYGRGKQPFWQIKTTWYMRSHFEWLKLSYRPSGLLRCVLGGSSLGVSWMDSRKCQTSPAFYCRPAGRGSPVTLGTGVTQRTALSPFFCVTWPSSIGGPPGLARNVIPPLRVPERFSSRCPHPKARLAWVTRFGKKRSRRASAAGIFFSSAPPPRRWPG